LFAVLDRKAKLYQRKENIHGCAAQLHEPLMAMPPQSAVDAALPRAQSKTLFPMKLPLRELTEQALLQQIAPAGALVNGQATSIYLHGRTGMYPGAGPRRGGVSNILKMAREGPARAAWSGAAQSAASTREWCVCNPGLSVKTNGHYTAVNLTVRPVEPAAAG
jgi:two-component system CheB/CheR fusion protein